MVFNMEFLAEAIACMLLWLLLSDFSPLLVVPWCFQVHLPLLLDDSPQGRKTWPTVEWRGGEKMSQGKALEGEGR